MVDFWNIRFVILPFYPWDYDSTLSLSLPRPMIENIYFLIYEYGGWYRFFFAYWPIIVEDIIWTFKWHSKYAYFNPEAYVISIKSFKVIYSYPKLEVSTVLLSFLNHKIGSFLVNMMIPVCNLQVSKLPTWCASVYILTFTALSLGSVSFGVIVSFSSG